jgi:hypothetical protein
MIYAPIIQMLLRVSCALMLIGHGWVCLNGYMPQINSILGDAGDLLLNDDMQKWVGFLQGLIFLIFSVLVLIRSKKRWFNSVYLLIGCNLLCFFVLKFINAKGGIGNFLEHSSQFCLPFILYFLVSTDSRKSKFIETVAIISISLTYIFHGLFGINFQHEFILFDHQRPQLFSDMVVVSLGLNQQSSELFFIVVGFLDFISVFFLVFTNEKLKSIGLKYMIFWGLITSLARPWSFFDNTNIVMSLNIWIPELLYRCPHFMIPVCLLIAMNKKQ